MKRMLVRYKVKAEYAAENETFIRDVFDALAQAAPPGLRYCSLKLDDGVSFVHIVETATEDNPLNLLPAFRAFTAEIRARCQEQPVATGFEPVGSYRIFTL
jgi:hypothetical protein